MTAVRWRRSLRAGQGGGRRRLGPISHRLVDVGRTVRHEDATVGATLDRLGAEGLGLVLLLLTLPTLIPLPGPFGIAFGALIALLAVQVGAGVRTLWLPAAIRRRPAPAGLLRSAIAAALPWIGRVESRLREHRLAGLTERRTRMALAWPLLLLGLAIMLPIPFGNVAPAVALIAFALGFMARDGLLVLLGLVLSLAALAWTGFLLLAGASVFEWAAALWTG